LPDLEAALQPGAGNVIKQCFAADLLR